MDFITSEHMAGFHKEVQEGCYECFREGRLLNARRIVTRRREEELGIDNQSKLQPRDGSTPWDKNPLG